MKGAPVEAEHQDPVSAPRPDPLRRPQGRRAAEERRREVLGRAEAGARSPDGPYEEIGARREGQVACQLPDRAADPAAHALGRHVGDVEE